MEQIIAQMNAELGGYVFDHAESGTARNSIKLVFHEPISPTEKSAERRPVQYKAVTIVGVTATDITLNKL